MRRFAVPGIITLVAVGLLAILTYGVSHDGTGSSLTGLVVRGRDPRAPNYAMALPVLGARGRESLADLRGKVVLLNVFSSWCQPCQTEAPVLEWAQRVMASHGGTVVGITYQDNVSDDTKFARQYHLTYPILRDVSGSFVQPYGLSGVPDTYLIDRRGRVLALSDSPITEQWLNRTLPKILGLPA
jgi:cytochrome c biogenesis protein CcmG/thiol:disulfide interchange protein DsbE